MTTLPSSLYQCSQVKAIDLAIIKNGTPGFELMMRAGRASFDLLVKIWPEADKITVVCGGGNNGGDGYIVAGLAMSSSLEVSVVSIVDTATLRGDAKLAYDFALKQGVQTVSILRTQESITDLSISGVVVDALLGIGLQGKIRENHAQLIRRINATKLPVLSLDIPSGLCGDSGSPLGDCMKASQTITYIALKQGLLAGGASYYTGELVFDDLGVKTSVNDLGIEPSAHRLIEEKPLLPPRSLNSHKGLFGSLVVIGGSEGMGGAGIMASEAGFIAGAGVVRLMTHEGHRAVALSRTPELMTSNYLHQQEVGRWLSGSSALVFGPGLEWSEEIDSLFRHFLDYEKPMVIDAQGLQFLADQPRLKSNWVLTPHPGEAAKLLGCKSDEIQRDRFFAAKAIQRKYGGVCVLKGAGTLVATAQRIHVCEHGNPSMSTAGMGDILAGLIGGLLAQGFGLEAAAKLAVWAHATAGDSATRKLGKHLRATDIYPFLRSLW